MKKLISISAVAALAFAVTLPLSADVLKGAVGGSSNSSVSKEGASTRNSVNAAGAAESRHAKVSGDGSIDANGNVDKAAMRRSEERVHKSYRSFARRLNKVEAKVVEQAKKTGRWTKEEVQERRERINEIRARFRDKADKMGDKLSEAEKAQFEADVTAQEEAAAEASKN